MLKRITQSKTAMRAASFLIYAYIRLVERTSRIVREPADTDSQLFSHGPAIGVMWHGQFMMAPLLKSKGSPAVCIMVARHGDAEIVDSTLRRFGMVTARGAGAGSRQRDRGGASALRQVLRFLADHAYVALTADVPPGPARKVSRGIVAIARLSGRPVIPFAVATSRFRRLRNWSRMVVNLPFSRLAIVAGNPIPPPREEGAAAEEATRLAIERELDRVTARAYELVGVKEDEAGRGGVMLGAYRLLTRWAEFATPLLLRYRERRGKEDSARLGERTGRSPTPRPEGSLAWVHAASVGETSAVLPLIARLAAERADLTVLLTTGTVTSAQMAAARLPGGALHHYAPLDSPRFVRRFLDHWRPDVAIFVESEIWPNFIIEAAERGIPLALVNGRLSQRSYRRWRRQPRMSRALFGRFDLILAQNERIARRFAGLGGRKVTPVGNLKMDAPPPPIDRREFKRLRELWKGRTLFLAASTHAGEETIIAEVHRRVKERYPDLLTVIAPRHPSRSGAIAEDLWRQGYKAALRSRAVDADDQCEIYIADTIGELGLFYALAPVAFIGGSLVGHGGQNPVEAIRLGAAVITGPHHHNFADAYATLLQRGGCQQVDSAAALAAHVSELLGDEAARAEQSRRAERAVADMGGALERTWQALVPLLPAAQGIRRAS